jgi:protein-disulfide isomerase
LRIQNLPQKIMCILLYASIACASLPLLAENAACTGPGSQKKAEIEQYVLKLYHSSPSSRINLIDEAKANQECFWKLEYLATSPRRKITLYLSPDGQSLSPALYDLRIDPLIKEKAAMAVIMKTLLATDAPSLGNAQAPVTIIEFADFECPYCRDLANVLEKQVLTEQSDHIRIIFKHFPIPIHPWAKTAAEMAACVALQKPSEFWEVHDYFFEHQSTLTLDNIRAATLAFVRSHPALDDKKFDFCVDNDLTARLVADDIALGQRYGIHITPTLFINGEQIVGYKSAAELNDLINAALPSKGGEAVQGHKLATVPALGRGTSQ